MNRSSAGIATGYKIDKWNLIPVQARDSSLLHGVQIDPLVHPDSDSMNTKRDVPKRKVVGA
jgi:hypothetical protein